MAGAVLVRRFGIGPAWSFPKQYDADLVAINEIRGGSYVFGDSRWSHNNSLTEEQKSTIGAVETLITGKYRCSLGRAEFYVYLDAADQLEAVGL